MGPGCVILPPIITLLPTSPLYLGIRWRGPGADNISFCRWRQCRLYCYCIGRSIYQSWTPFYKEGTLLVLLLFAAAASATASAITTAAATAAPAAAAAAVKTGSLKIEFLKRGTIRSQIAKCPGTVDEENCVMKRP